MQLATLFTPLAICSDSSVSWINVLALNAALNPKHSSYPNQINSGQIKRTLIFSSISTLLSRKHCKVLTQWGDDLFHHVCELTNLGSASNVRFCHVSKLFCQTTKDAERTHKPCPSQYRWFRSLTSFMRFVFPAQMSGGIIWTITRCVFRCRPPLNSGGIYVTQIFCEISFLLFLPWHM